MDGLTRQNEAFPETRRTWMGRLLQDGELNEARRHIMDAYAWPLRVYCRGCSLRWVGDPDDLVRGFFADRLSRPAFLHRWLESNRPLRFWLIVGFKHYMLERARSARRAADREKALELDAEGSRIDQEFERACAVQLVRHALQRTEAACARNGLADHWNIFDLYHLRDVPLEQIAADKNIAVSRAATMKRTAVNRFRATLRELLSWNGADQHQIDTEIQALRGGLR